MTQTPAAASEGQRIAFDKYTLTMHKQGFMTATINGEEWPARDLIGDKLVLAMFERIAELEAIANSDDGAGGDGMKLHLENKRLREQVERFYERQALATESDGILSAENGQLREQLAAMTAERDEATLELESLRGAHCGGDCIAAPCQHCDGSMRTIGTVDRQKASIAELQEDVTSITAERDDSLDRLAKTFAICKELTDDLAASRLALAQSVEMCAKVCEDEATHIADNAEKLKKFDFEIDEARCRELCSMYLKEFAANIRSLSPADLIANARADAMDAERWRAIELLWFCGSLTLDCDDDGKCRMMFEGAEHADFNHFGDSQDDCLDSWMSKNDAAIANLPPTTKGT